jgi:histidyl-tRNA synthetase
MIQKPRGTLDILPGESEKWQYIEETIRNICKTYGFGEIRVPTFEATELFQRGVGDTTDIVQKEMYTFTDRENRSFGRDRDHRSSGRRFNNDNNRRGGFFRRDK